VNSLGVVAPALTALVLFLLAIRSGRWSVWIAGYLCVILAVAAALQASQGSSATAPGEPAATQPSERAGVPLHAEPAGTGPERGPATGRPT
jgi:hypothetical protein